MLQILIIACGISLYFSSFAPRAQPAQTAEAVPSEFPAPSSAQDLCRSWVNGVGCQIRGIYTRSCPALQGFHGKALNKSCQTSRSVKGAMIPWNISSSQLRTIAKYVRRAWFATGIMRSSLWWKVQLGLLRTTSCCYKHVLMATT